MPNAKIKLNGTQLFATDHIKYVGITFDEHLTFQRHIKLVSMQMQAANSNSIEILGAVILRLTGKSKSNEIYTTKQMVYVTKDSNKLFLSREACIALYMISDKFPTIGEVNQISKIESPPNKGESISIESAITCPCECPRRELPPKKPTTIPFAPTVENLQN